MTIVLMSNRSFGYHGYGSHCFDCPGCVVWVTRVLDVTCLPVVGDLVWVLHVDAICLSYHGNLLDACCLAAMAALRDSEFSRRDKRKF